MIGSVLETADLARLLGYDRPADIARRLREQGIAFKTGRDGAPFTTVEALNFSLGVPTTLQLDSKLDPSMF